MCNTEIISSERLKKLGLQKTYNLYEISDWLCKEKNININVQYFPPSDNKKAFYGYTIFYPDGAKVQCNGFSQFEDAFISSIQSVINELEKSITENEDFSIFVKELNIFLQSEHTFSNSMIEKYGKDRYFNMVKNFFYKLLKNN